MTDQHARFLIADDHPPMREMIRRFCLAPEGEFEEVGDGKAAVAAFHQFQPDWVLMDLDMPVMNGLDATRLIRAFNTDVRIIVITEHDTEALRAASIAAGATAFLAKSELPKLSNLLASI